MRYLLILCLALTSVGASAEAYRWVDPQGRTIISDTPPPGRARDVSKAGSASETSDGLPYEVRRAVDNFPVTLYTSADCASECKQARDFLNARGVPFTEKMLQKQEDVDELKKLVGDAFVPALKVGKQSFRGFEPAAYTNLLDLAGYPKSAAYGSKPSGGLAK
ncbi:MAG TPA: glutaredoxin family protein [Azonexus sp.]|nr:glutaredoxin family protein [Azonexus sp.]